MKKWIIFPLIVLLLLVWPIHRMATRPNNVISDGVYIGSIKVAGLDRDRAKQYLAPFFDRMLDEPIIVSYQNSTERLQPRDMGISYDLNKALDQAVAPNRSRKEINFWPEVVFDQDKYLSFSQSFKQRWEREPKNAQFVIAQGTLAIEPSQPGRSLNFDEFVNDVVSRLFLPQHRVVLLEIENLPPAVATEDLEKLGINTRRSSFSTSFDPNNQNRSENLRLAAEALHLIVIEPGEEISFNEVVGPRAIEYGFREAPVILNGELVPDIGGGVCQVSSTLFNAGLLGGLDVVSRAPHSIPSAYVDLGRDAVVADGLKDLVMKNNQDGALLIETKVGYGRVEVDIWGPRSDIAYELYTEIERVIPRGIDRVHDPSLDKGLEIEKVGRDGYQVSLWRRALKGNGSRVERIAISYYPPKNDEIRSNL